MRWPGEGDGAHAPRQIVWLRVSAKVLRVCMEMGGTCFWGYVSDPNKPSDAWGGILRHPGWFVNSYDTAQERDRALWMIRVMQTDTAPSRHLASQPQNR